MPTPTIISLFPLTLTLAGLPPDLNHGYVQVQYKTPSGTLGLRNQLRASTKRWIAQTTNLITNAANLAGWHVPPQTPLRVQITYCCPRVLTWDADGRQKFLLDACKDAIGVDDRYIVDLHPVKLRAPKGVTPWTVLTIQAAALRAVEVQDVPLEVA